MLTVSSQAKTNTEIIKVITLKKEKMRKVVYYVACSIDGYISGRGDDISGFVGTGNEWKSDLQFAIQLLLGLLKIVLPICLTYL